MQWNLSRRGNKYGKTSFFCLLEKKNIRSFVDFRKSGIFAPHLEKCSFEKEQAAIAQLVERDLAKVEVAGSSPVCRSIF